jgi:hypothetical protein
LRILFITRHFGCLRNFEAPIAQLAGEGYKLHLVALTDDILGGLPMVQRWAARTPQITFERLTSPPLEHMKADLLERVHLMVDYTRYLDPAYRDADGLVARARRRTPQGLLHLLDRRGARWWPARRTLSWALRKLESATPRRPEVDGFLAAQAPDLVLFTPLIGLGSEEQDYLSAARQLGLRTIFSVWSWDNLSSKSIIRTMPDVVTVWNDTQRQEALQLHGVPDDRIAVTGAQAFDQWFDRTPRRSRAEFSARVGLPADRPFLLWVCSALFKGSPVEASFVREWITSIRRSADPVLRDVPVLVRPHPSRLKEWATVTLDDLGPVSLFGANPVDAEAKDDYFESMFYSAAVAGLNTSAFLEAAIVGRPVYTVMLPEYRENQEGTLHFPYLLDVAGGLLHASRSLNAHLTDLRGALLEPATAAERSVRFVKAFIRPHGLEVSATARFIDVVKRRMAAPPPARARATVAAPVFHRVLAWLEREGQHGKVKEWLMSPTEYAEAVKRRDRLAADRSARAERAQQRREALEQHRAKKRSQETSKAAGDPA